MINVLAEAEADMSRDPRLHHHPTVNKHSTKSRQSRAFNHSPLNYAAPLLPLTG